MVYIILILSLLGIIFGANNLVDGSSAIARKFNISEFIIGALIVGVGTSMPELVVSLIGTIQNKPDIAIGNVVGSNIFNILGILGLTALIFPIPIKKENTTFDVLFCIFISFLLLILTIGINDGILTTLGGIVLFAMFILYTIISYKTNKSSDDIDIKKESTWLSILKIVGGLTILVLSCDYFIDNSIILAKNWGLSDATIALTLIACGTSLPELAASTIAAFKKNTQIALGNIIGSNIFNISFILGSCSIISPLCSTNITNIDYWLMCVATIIVFCCGLFGKINRLIGGIMLLIFILYTYFLINFIN